MLSPGPRYNPISPYPNFSKAQLDMRRKVEILQYKKNSTQTTQLTKSQKYASVVSGSYRANTNKICNKNLLQPTPTSASGIPGPLMFLQYNPTIPLYNYQTKQDVNAFLNVLPEKWQINIGDTSISTTLISTENQVQNTNLFITTYSVPETLVFTLVIQNINSDNYNFTIGMPIGIYVSGTTTSSQPLKVQFYLLNAKINVYNYTNPNKYYTANSSESILVNGKLLSNTIQLNDISGSFIVNGSSMSPPINFSGSQYFANLYVPKIPLLIQYGDLYDFKFSYDIYTTVSSVSGDTVVGNTILNYNAGIYTNISLTTSHVNCTFTPQPNNVLNHYQKFSVKGSTVV